MAGKNDILASMRPRQAVASVDNSLAGAPASARVPASPSTPGSSSAHGQVNVNDAGANKEAGVSGTPVSGDDANFEMRKQEALAGYDRVTKILEDRMKKYEPEDEATRQRRERRERSRRIVTAVGDGLSALSNLIFTTKYAPDSYRHEKSQSAALEAHYDKMKAEREAAADRYMNFALKLGDVENQRAATLRDLEDWRERQRKAKDAADRDNKRFSWEEEERPEIMRKRKADADYSENRAKTEKVQAEMEADRITSIINRNNRSGISGGRSGKKYVLHAPDGDKVFDTAPEYNAAVYAYAEQYGLADIWTMGNKGREIVAPVAAVAGSVENVPKGSKPSAKSKFSIHK